MFSCCFLQNPNDISYVYSGYAPMSVRLAQIAHRPGWRSITEALNLLPGPTIDEIQQIPIALRRRSVYSWSNAFQFSTNANSSWFQMYFYCRKFQQFHWFQKHGAKSYAGVLFGWSDTSWDSCTEVLVPAGRQYVSLLLMFWLFPLTLLNF